MSTTINTSLILPSDSDTEVLRKRMLQTVLRSSVMDPRQKRFNELRREGLDSETAAELAGLNEWQPEARAGAIMEYAAQHTQGLVDVEYTAVRETNQALRAVGSAAGAALGSTVGMSLFRFVSRNSTILSVAGIAGGGVVAAVLTAKLVTAALGPKLAAVAAANVLSASGIISAALFMTKKR